ncbi:hypothetical protein ACFQZC_00845 [Streptacidiphilus monticola]
MSVDVVPALWNAEKVFVRKAAQQGTQDLGYARGVAGGTWMTDAVCSGSGTVEVRLDPIVSFTLHCGVGTKPEYDESALGSRGTVHITVISHTSGRWALSVGWTHVVSAGT